MPTQVSRPRFQPATRNWVPWPSTNHRTLGGPPCSSTRRRRSSRFTWRSLSALRWLTAARACRPRKPSVRWRPAARSAPAPTSARARRAAKAERALAASGEERAGSNIGKGQMKAADYVLVPDIANRNRNSGGTNVGGMLGGLLPHGIGALAGGISLKSKTADVVLTLTDVRSTEQVALEQGHAKKTDLGWMGGGGGVGFFGGFAAAGASSYANTEIGQVVATAYAEAYAKLVADVKAQAPDAKADNVQQSVSMAKPGKMYANSDLKSAVVRDLDPGMMLYPTGDKMGVWWKVTDELGNAGWVVSTNFKPAH